jgi:hypothetical protein
MIKEVASFLSGASLSLLEAEPTICQQSERMLGARAWASVKAAEAKERAILSLTVVGGGGGGVGHYACFIYSFQL